MLGDDFYDWLLENNYQRGTANSRKANCLTVCKYEGDLDKLFADDCCHSLLSRLEYSTDDERHQRQPKHNIPINGNVRTGTATLKQAVRLYVEFKNGKKKDVCGPKSGERNNLLGVISDWPKWESPTDDEIFELAQITIKYIRFLSPMIIEQIANDNMTHCDKWRNLLSKSNVNPNLYLWEMSPCCFPGVRRHAGGAEIAAFRKHIEIESIPDALKLDDNHFPKEIWSFIFTKKKFSSSGQIGYSLAHLFDHKLSNNRMKDELEFIAGRDSYSESPCYGLYTCPSNAAYVPNILLKPTDFNLTLRRLLFQKAESLYGGCCNILPPFIRIPKPKSERWDINNFKWGECVGNSDNLCAFLDYRNEIMTKLFSENGRQ